MVRERGGKKGIESDDRFYLTTMAASAIGKLPTEYRWYRIMLILAAPQELCDNLVNAPTERRQQPRCVRCSQNISRSSNYSFCFGKCMI